MKKTNLSCLAAGVFALALSGGSALGGIVTDSPDLPPNDGVYRTADDVHAEFSGPGLEIVLMDAIHAPIAEEVQRRQDGADEIETFATSLFAKSVTNIPSFGLVDFEDMGTLFGSMEVRSIGKWGQTTGTFDTEILALQLDGAGTLNPTQISIQLSSTQPSTGQTTITDLGGGFYEIDSFFDIFVDLIIDPNGAAGVGPIVVPQANGPIHVDLVPEPNSLALAGFGAFGLLGFVRRRRRRVA